MSQSRNRRERLRGEGEELLEWVIDHANDQQWREWLRLPLEHALANGDMHFAKKLLRAGANGGAGYTGIRGRSLLTAAAEGNATGAVRMMLKAGCRRDVNVMDRSGEDDHILDGPRSALHWAVDLVVERDEDESGRLSDIVSLLDVGAIVDIRDGCNQTPLHCAAGHGSNEVVDLLLARGANVDAWDSMGRTPLHLAVQMEQRSFACVKTLLRAGADVNLRTTEEATGQRTPSPLYTAAAANNVAAMKELIAFGADVNGCGEDGCTALSVAVAKGNVSAIDLLIEKGADVNACSDGGITPLIRSVDWHFNAFRCRYEQSTLNNICNKIIPALLAAGADINAKADNGDTALSRSCDRLLDEVVETLLRYDADEVAVKSYFPSDSAMGVFLDDSPDKAAKRADRESRICAMLASAPTDRIWRRRGWVVMLRERVRPWAVIADAIVRNAEGATRSGRARDEAHELPCHSHNVSAVATQSPELVPPMSQVLEYPSADGCSVAGVRGAISSPARQEHRVQKRGKRRGETTVVSKPFGLKEFQESPCGQAFYEVVVRTTMLQEEEVFKKITSFL